MIRFHHAQHTHLQPYRFHQDRALSQIQFLSYTHNSIHRLRKVQMAFFLSEDKLAAAPSARCRLAAFPSLQSYEGLSKHNPCHT